MTATATRRAVGIVRVSQVNGREGDSFVSPREQADRIREACERDGLRLVSAFGDNGIADELDVSGGTPLARRPGLLTAVQAIEDGRADVLVTAYFDRLVRSLRVQDEVVSRVEAAGGHVLALDVGRVSGATASQWLSGTMLGAVSEYVRRTAAEHSAEAQRRAIEEGRPPIILPPGLRRVGDRIEVDAKPAAAVRRAVEMRADGATFAAIREHLREHGIERSYHGVQTLLRSRLLVGEMVFGDQRGTVPAIVDCETWERAQRMSVPRGRRATSDRLLARLGVLRCGTCGSRMVVGTAKNREYPIYRCPPVGDCTRRVTIAAELVEGLVIERVRELLAGIEGTASSDDRVREAAAAVDRAQRDLDAAVRTFAAAGLDGESAAVDRLAELRGARDAARERHEQLAAAQAATAVAVSVADWDDLARDERRDLIRAVVERVMIAPGGRGAERVTIEDRTV